MTTAVSPDFVHLHLHTQYSLLEGAIRVSPLMKRAKELGYKAVAITDTQNLFGAIDFYLEAKAQGIKPIIGCEILYSPEGLSAAPVSVVTQVDRKPKRFHLVLLCKNIEGYRNLCQLITQAYESSVKLLGDPTKAVVTKAMLDQWGDGLVVLSGCLKSILSYHILKGDESEALEEISWLQKRFKSDFYLELQDTLIPEQEWVNDRLFSIAEKLKIECVGTTDCHYLMPEDSEAQEILQCIEHGRNLDFDRPKSMVPSEFWFKPAEMMIERFKRYPGASENTVKIAEKCDLKFEFKDKEGRPIYHLPNFRPEGMSDQKKFDTDGWLREEARMGLKRRFGEKSFEGKISKPDWKESEKGYHARLEDELNMIIRTGFGGYFLIVADFINWAKTNRIPVGPGRGSGAGSLVSYALRITDLDPIEYKLLFERFINPERVSMPDFDVDFCQDRRGEVIEYVTRKYGAENVCQIITFGKLQARAVIKDVGRVLGLTFAETDQLTKLLPDELNIKLSDAIEREPQLKERMAQDPRLAKVMSYALKLEGLSRNAGVHAAGVIITEKPVVQYCPLYVGKDGVAVSQFDKDFAEKIGLIKFDFLGLKTLTVVDNAVKLIRLANVKDKDFDIDVIPHNDSKVFELISSGDTDGVFQVESSGMKDLCTRLMPGSIEDVTAINALYRPGPLGSGMVDDFIDCKHGRKPIHYEVPALEPILKETYGVILYQEQVMQIARDLAGYSLGQADMLRRAMGKKKADEMAEHKDSFMKGAAARGFDIRKAEGIFDLMAKFAEYGFNKSHSAAYAVLTYQTAYLKAHFPEEFMAALMTTEMSNTDKLAKYISDAKRHDIVVLPPDVNKSHKVFGVEAVDASGKKGIRFGLEAIKGVGGVAVDCILEARTGEKGFFRDVIDFANRVPTRKVNKKVMEALTLSGAFDGVSTVNRATLFASLESLIDHASEEQEERALGQSSLFDSFSAEEIKLTAPSEKIFKPVEEWPSAQKLAKEKQVVGFYVSGHPMDHWQKISEDWLGWSLEKIHSSGQTLASPAASAQSGGANQGGYRRPQKKEIRVSGLVSEMKEITTKKGTRMAFVQMEDLTSKMEVIFFPESYAASQEMLKQAIAQAEPILLTAEVEVKDEAVKLFARSIEWLEDASKKRVRSVVLKLNPGEISVDQLRDLKKTLLENRGQYPVRFDFEDAKYKTTLALPNAFLVSGTPKMIASVNQIFKKEIVELR